MRVTEAKVRKIRIENIDGIDPIVIYLENFEIGQGKITICCWDKAWTQFWGSMGNMNMQQFIISCNNDYLAGKFIPYERSHKRNKPSGEYLYFCKILDVVRQVFIGMQELQSGPLQEVTGD